MKSLMIFAFSLSFLFANSVNAAKLAERVDQVYARSTYQGGYPLALMASETTGCPVEAPVTCQNVDAPNLQCCPSGQFCHIKPFFGNQYCCPTEADCLQALLLFPVCSNSSWIMYQGDPYLFCCEPGYTAISGNGGAGFCEPVGIAVPANQLANTLSQATVPATSQPSSTAAVASILDTTTTALVTTGTTAGTKTITAGTNATSSVTVSKATGASSALSTSASATAITASTVANPASGSASSTSAASGSATVFASASAKTSTNVGASNSPAALQAVLMLCFGVGIMALLG